MFLVSGEFCSPANTSFPNREKSVITAGDKYLFSVNVVGLNDTKPSIPPR